MSKTLFITGFPGFLADRLILRLLERHPDPARVVALVHPSQFDRAERFLDALAATHPNQAEQVTLITGDITAAHLGLSLEQYYDLAAQVTEIFHLAAVYDMTSDYGFKVNVEGTRRLLNFAEQIPAGALRRFHHVSTCYVSGTHAGDFQESDLDVGQDFHNSYEQSKFMAEADVQNRLADGLPVTIYRPAILVNDSTDGHLPESEGLYPVIQSLLRQPSVAFLPVVGNPTQHEANIVPRDFVADALDYLASLDDSEGKTYHLCDPHPLRVDEIIDLVAGATHKQIVRVPLPLWMAKPGFKFLPGVRYMTGFTSESLDYFAHPARYKCETTLRDLAGSGITCPPFASYLDRLLDTLTPNPSPPLLRRAEG